MKKLLIIALLAFSCSEQEIKPKSIVGDWKFSSGNVSGQFEIVDYDGVYVVDNGGGSFTINGNRYPIDYKSEIVWDPPKTIGIRLASKGSYIFFNDTDYNKDFSVLTSLRWVYFEDGGDKETIVLETIKITR